MKIKNVWKKSGSCKIWMRAVALFLVVVFAPEQVISQAQILPRREVVSLPALKSAGFEKQIAFNIKESLNALQKAELAQFPNNVLIERAYKGKLNKEYIDRVYKQLVDSRNNIVTCGAYALYNLLTTVYEGREMKDEGREEDKNHPSSLIPRPSSLIPHPSLLIPRPSLFDIANTLILVDLLSSTEGQPTFRGNELEISLYSLIKSAEVYGVKLQAFHLTAFKTDLESLNKHISPPFIAVVTMDSPHAVLVKNINQHGVLIIDNDKEKLLSLQEFKNRFMGYCLSIEVNYAENINPINQEELKSIIVSGRKSSNYEDLNIGKDLLMNYLYSFVTMGIGSVATSAATSAASGLTGVTRSIVYVGTKAVTQAALQAGAGYVMGRVAGGSKGAKYGMIGGAVSGGLGGLFGGIKAVRSPDFANNISASQGLWGNFKANFSAGMSQHYGQVSRFSAALYGPVAPFVNRILFKTFEKKWGENTALIASYAAGGFIEAFVTKLSKPLFGESCDGQINRSPTTAGPILDSALWTGILDGLAIAGTEYIVRNHTSINRLGKSKDKEDKAQAEALKRIIYRDVSSTLIAFVDMHKKPDIAVPPEDINRLPIKIEPKKSLFFQIYSIDTLKDIAGIATLGILGMSDRVQKLFEGKDGMGNKFGSWFSKPVFSQGTATGYINQLRYDDNGGLTTFGNVVRGSRFLLGVASGGFLGFDAQTSRWLEKKLDFSFKGEPGFLNKPLQDFAKWWFRPIGSSDTGQGKVVEGLNFGWTITGHYQNDVRHRKGTPEEISKLKDLKVGWGNEALKEYNKLKQDGVKNPDIDAIYRKIVKANENLLDGLGLKSVSFEIWDAPWINKKDGLYSSGEIEIESAKNKEAVNVVKDMGYHFNKDSGKIEQGNPYEIFSFDIKGYKFEITGGSAIPKLKEIFWREENDAPDQISDPRSAAIDDAFKDLKQQTQLSQSTTPFEATRDLTGANSTEKSGKSFEPSSAPEFKTGAFNKGDEVVFWQAVDDGKGKKWDITDVTLRKSDTLVKMEYTDNDGVTWGREFGLKDGDPLHFVTPTEAAKMFQPSASADPDKFLQKDFMEDIKYNGEASTTDTPPRMKGGGSPGDPAFGPGKYTHRPYTPYSKEKEGVLTGKIPSESKPSLLSKIFSTATLRDILGIGSLGILGMSDRAQNYFDNKDSTFGKWFSKPVFSQGTITGSLYNSISPDNSSKPSPSTGKPKAFLSAESLDRLSKIFEGNPQEREDFKNSLPYEVLNDPSRPTLNGVNLGLSPDEKIEIKTFSPEGPFELGTGGGPGSPVPGPGKYGITGAPNVYSTPPASPVPRSTGIIEETLDF